VAIIGILAAIAIPNFLQAQVRAKVARAKAEMKTVATALEVYNVDQNQYPWINQNPGYDIPRTLTTPVDYLTSLPKDPFGPSMAYDIYLPYLTTNDYYYATKKYFDFHGFLWKVYPGGSEGSPAIWDLQNKGPDRAWARWPAEGGSGVAELDQPFQWQYDPTNGTISAGNIVFAGRRGSSSVNPAKGGMRDNARF
jgi:type II secretory pathway pseudopilin PulG